MLHKWVFLKPTEHKILKEMSFLEAINQTTKYNNIDALINQNTKAYHAQSIKLVMSTQKQEIQFLFTSSKS